MSSYLNFPNPTITGQPKLQQYGPFQNPVIYVPPHGRGFYNSSNKKDCLIEIKTPIYRNKAPWNTENYKNSIQ